MSYYLRKKGLSLTQDQVLLLKQSVAQRFYQFREKRKGLKFSIDNIMKYDSEKDNDNEICNKNYNENM